MQVAGWADVKAGDYIIDVCAAPGGKAIHLAEALRGTGHVEARDLTDYKVQIMQDNIMRSGLLKLRRCGWMRAALMRRLSGKRTL